MAAAQGKILYMLLANKVVSTSDSCERVFTAKGMQEIGKKRPFSLY